MSIEQALAENTAAINNLIAVWSKLNAQAEKIDKLPAAEKVVAAGKPVKAAPAAAVTPPASAPAPAEAAAPAPAAVSPSDAVDYATLQKAVFALAGKSKPAALDVAQSFGVKTFKELDAAKWGDALAAVNAKLAEV